MLYLYDYCFIQYRLVNIFFTKMLETNALI